MGLKIWQLQIQLQASLGFMSMQDIAIQTDTVFDVLDVIWPIVKELGLACDSPAFNKTNTGNSNFFAYVGHASILACPQKIGLK